MQPFSHKWWSDEIEEGAFEYSKPDSVYDKDYFYSQHHPNKEVAENLYNYMQQTYKLHYDRYFKSVLEFGGGGGEITLQFHDDRLDYYVVEPTEYGIEKLLANGIDNYRIIKSDIRFFLPLEKKFDLVMCTEVAEHIEPWFASKVVEVCTTHSDTVWFSAANIYMNPHRHHPNVAPIWAWDNIFSEFGYNYIKLDGRHDRADRMYFRD